MVCCSIAGARDRVCLQLVCFAGDNGGKGDIIGRPRTKQPVCRVGVRIYMCVAMIILISGCRERE